MWNLVTVGFKIVPNVILGLLVLFVSGFVLFWFVFVFNDTQKHNIFAKRILDSKAGDTGELRDNILIKSSPYELCNIQWALRTVTDFMPLLIHVLEGQVS